MPVASAAKAPARCLGMSETAGAFVCSKQKLGLRESEQHLLHILERELDVSV